MKDLCPPCPEPKPVVLVDQLPETLCPCPEPEVKRPDILPVIRVETIVTDTLLDTLEKVHRTYNCPHDIVKTDTYKPALIHGKPPRGIFGEQYEFIYTVTLGEPPFTFSIRDGVLPFGLEFTTSGRIHGIPGEIGRFNFVVHVIDDRRRSKTMFSSLDILG